MNDTPIANDEVGALAEWEPVQRHWGWLLALGILWGIMGALAILVPFAASLATELLIGAVLVVGGIFQIIHAFSCRGWSGFGLHMGGGVLAVLFGGVLLAFPIHGVLGLTIALGVLFLVHGGLRLYAAWRHRGKRSWGWVALSGGLGMAIGALILAGWPSTALWAIGLLVGIDLIFAGASMIMLALAARDAARS